LSRPVVAFTAVRYTPRRAAWGAIHMATQRRLLARAPGLRFRKLLGMGSGIGFSARPDPRAWSLLTVWDRLADFERFHADSPVMAQYRRRGSEVYTLVLDPLSSHGRWDGAEPFGPGAPEAPPGDRPVAVLTRASIRLSRLHRFWSRVAPVDATLRDHPELALTFGVGELPWIRQATLSVWRTADGMRAWAYRSSAHAEVVRRTRDERWYAEECFARFALVETRGTWGGADPLAALPLRQG
jgi:heme-degrading monooxygenase HmoA